MSKFEPKESFVFWKIKNFSYGFEAIDSLEFSYAGSRFHLNIKPRDVECRLVPPPGYSGNCSLQYALHFVPCDGSLPLSAIGSCLKVPKETLFETRRKAFLPEDTLTVHFEFPHTSDYTIPYNIYIQSQIGVRRKCWLWCLKGLKPTSDNEIDRKTTGFSDIYGSVDLIIKSNRHGIHDSEDEQFYIEITRKNGGKCSCALKISILGLECEVVETVTKEFLFKEQDEWVSVPLCDSSALLPHHGDGDCFLFLECNVAISLGKVTDEVDVHSSGDISMLPDGWEDFLTLFKPPCVCVRRAE